MGFPRQEYWSGLPFSPPGDLPDPGVEPASPALTGRFDTTEPPGKPLKENRSREYSAKILKDFQVCNMAEKLTGT